MRAGDRDRDEPSHLQGHVSSRRNKRIQGEDVRGTFQGGESLVKKVLTRLSHVDKQGNLPSPMNWVIAWMDLCKVGGVDDGQHLPVQ